MPLKNKVSSRVPDSPATQRQSVDTVDRAILRVLSDDARITVTELASRVNISRANAYARLARLETSGVVRGYQVRLDTRAIGLEVAALIFLTVEQPEWRDIREQLLEIPEVEFVGFATGEFDFVVLVRAAHTNELRDVVLERFQALPSIRRTETVLLLDDVDRAPLIPDL